MGRRKVHFLCAHLPPLRCRRRPAPTARAMIIGVRKHLLRSEARVEDGVVRVCGRLPPPLLRALARVSHVCDKKEKSIDVFNADTFSVSYWMN